MVENGNRLMKFLLKSLKEFICPKNHFSLEDGFLELLSELNQLINASEQGFHTTTKYFSKCLAVHEANLLKHNIKWVNRYNDVRRRLLTELNNQEGKNWESIDVLGHIDFYLQETISHLLFPMPLDPMEHPESLFCLEEDKYHIRALALQVSSQVRGSLEAMNLDLMGGIGGTQNFPHDEIAGNHSANISDEGRKLTQSEKSTAFALAPILETYRLESLAEWDLWINNRMNQFNDRLLREKGETTSNLPSNLGAYKPLYNNSGDLDDTTQKFRAANGQTPLFISTATGKDGKLSQNSDFLISPATSNKVISMTKINPKVSQYYASKILPARFEHIVKAESMALEQRAIYEKSFLELAYSKNIKREREIFLHDCKREKQAIALEIAEFQRGVDENIAFSVATSKVECMKVLAQKAQRVTSNAFTSLKNKTNLNSNLEDTPKFSLQKIANGKKLHDSNEFYLPELHDLLVELGDKEEVCAVGSTLVSELTGNEMGDDGTKQILALLHEEFSRIKHSLMNDLESLIGEI